MLTDSRKRGREGEAGRETSMWERKINLLPLIHTSTGTEPETLAYALTRDQTHKLLAYGMMVQPSEPHWTGFIIYIFNATLYISLW